MSGFRIESADDLPEALRFEFDTTGPQGGDAGHGGHATLMIYSENGVNSVMVQGPDGLPVYSIGGDCTPWSLVIRAEGDWELNGLANALISLGKGIKTQIKHDRERRRITETVRAAVAGIKA